MPILKSESRKNRSSRIRGGDIISVDAEGFVEVSAEVASLLLSKEFEFMGFVLSEGSEIKKIEESEPLKVEKGDDIKTPELTPTTPDEIIEEIEKSDNASLIELINATEKYDDLKEIAKSLELPEAEWGGIKRKDYFKNYLTAKLQ